MLSLSLPGRVFLCTLPTDMRKSFDSLTGLVTQHLGQDPLSGDLFVFRSKRGDRLKLLYWDSDGLAIWYKRLETGSFQLPTIARDATSIEMTRTQLLLILSGIDLGSARQRKRYQRPAPEAENRPLST
jgi:transposase